MAAEIYCFLPRWLYSRSDYQPSGSFNFTILFKGTISKEQLEKILNLKIFSFYFSSCSRIPQKRTHTKLIFKWLRDSQRNGKDKSLLKIILCEKQVRPYFKARYSHQAKQGAILGQTFVESFTFQRNFFSPQTKRTQIIYTRK